MPGPVFIGVRFLVVSLILLLFVFIIFVSFHSKQILSLCGVGLLGVCLTASLGICGVGDRDLVWRGIHQWASPWSLRRLFFGYLPSETESRILMSFLSQLSAYWCYLTNGWRRTKSDLFLIGINDAFCSLCDELSVMSNIASIASICVQLFVVGISGLAFASMTTNLIFVQLRLSLCLLFQRLSRRFIRYLPKLNVPYM